MAQSVPPGDIQTQPNAKLFFTPPYDIKKLYSLKITNTSYRRIGWTLRTTNSEIISVDPPHGVLDPKQSSTITVSCEPFLYDKEKNKSDRLTFKWTNSPENSAKQFTMEWFNNTGYSRKKLMNIEYTQDSMRMGTKRAAASSCRENLIALNDNRKNRHTYAQSTESSRRRSKPVVPYKKRQTKK